MKKKLGRLPRTLVAIGLSASLTSVIAIALFSPRAEAQPRDGSAGSGSAVGTTGSAGGTSAGSAEATGSGSAAGSATGSAGPGSAEAGSGSGVGAGSDTGSAGAGSGSDGAGSGSAVGEPTVGPPKPKRTKVTEVDCAKSSPKYVVKDDYSVGMLFADPKRDAHLKPYDIEVNDVVEFQMGTSDVVPDPTESDVNLKAPANKSTCLVFNAEGTFGFHSTANKHGKLVVKAWYSRLAERKVEDDDGGTFWMPRAVNKPADQSDQMFYAVLALSVFFFVGITIAVVYLTWKYRHRPGHKAEKSATHNDALEITWTIIPTIITVFLFWYGWRSYIHVVTPPNQAIEIGVTAQRWTWEFKHATGAKDVDLHVPAGQPVRLVMTSTDVLHAFYAPVLRVKQDIIPRRYTYVWFDAQKPGTYRLNCAEYCGTNHSQMGINSEGRRAVVVVHKPGDYERYLADKQALESNLPPEQLGKSVYEKKCVTCHSNDGSPRIGPTFYKTFGTMVPLTTPVKMDENYIRESILAPQAKMRAGYPPSMPSFEGSLKEAELEGLIAYIKSLK